MAADSSSRRNVAAREKGPGSCDCRETIFEIPRLRLPLREGTNMETPKNMAEEDDTYM